jgi:two-component system sensor histidine kinase MprB
MSFRMRLTVLVSLAVAAAIVGTSFVVYYTDRSQLIDQIDSELKASQALLPPRDAHFGPSHGGPPGPSSKAVSRTIAIGSRQIVLPSSLTAVQVSVASRAAGVAFARPPRFSNRTIKGVHLRVLTFVLPNRVVQISGSMQEVDRNLAHLRWLLVFISLGGIGAAAILGSLVSRRAIAPLRRLTETTERIVETGDLSERTGQRGRDEISRLSTRLDELLASLDASLRAQRQLVADASHELRTPIATLRANVELLADPGALDANERAEVLVDAQDELESMTTLVGELVELARGEEREVAPREFRLDDVVKAVVDRAARRSPGLSFRTQLEPSVVTGVPERVERAVSNLLDNARKWSPAGETVDVAVYDGRVEVRDRGPGIADEDVPLVFNRFYRSVTARGMPGAGLGLAIVKQIAEAHGGSVSIDRASDGGAIVWLQLSHTR